jgi:TPP-dependent pyruvate/acetoin dehydrogenase alpha subunit
MLRGRLLLSSTSRRAAAHCARRLRADSSRCLSSLTDLRNDFQKEIAALPEQAGMENLESFLASKSSSAYAAAAAALGRWSHIRPPEPPAEGYKYTMSKEEIQLTIDAAMATFCLHVESRIAALVGKGFYTIGPCGEEMLSAAAFSLESYDDVALHYRHLGISLARQLRRRGPECMPGLLLDRARGYTVSKQDPVTGGVHCSIGSHQGPGRDYLVTSTLASQCPPAVGRALGYSLALQQQQGERKKNSKPVSMVTVGDGSVHNHHFWSAFHLARHAKHRSIQCPLIVGISNNGLSISYETKDYVNTLFQQDPLVSLFQADGRDMMSVYDQTKQAAKYARQRSAPAVILYQKIMRRFGHAASDRQHAYLDPGQIQAMADSNVMECAIAQAVEVNNAYTYAEVKDRLEEIRTGTRAAFDKASQEEKVTRYDMLQQVEQPMVPVPRLPPSMSEKLPTSEKPKGKLEVMRKHMTRVLEESLTDDPFCYLPR